MFATESDQRLLRWASIDGQEYSPSPVQIYFRGLFNPIPEVCVCGKYSESDYLEAELLEDGGLPEESFVFRPKALDGCLVRLTPRWENKQFDGRVASFSRLKLLVGDRRHRYRLRITWYEHYEGGFRSVASIVSARCFTIGAHQGKRKPGGARGFLSSSTAGSLSSSSSGSAVDAQVSKRKRSQKFRTGSPCPSASLSIPLAVTIAESPPPVPATPPTVHPSITLASPEDLASSFSLFLAPEALVRECFWSTAIERCATPFNTLQPVEISIESSY